MGFRQEPKQCMRVQQQLHSMYSLKSSNGASKSADIQNRPGIPFHKPGVADCTVADSFSTLATTLTFPCRNSGGRGKWTLPSGSGSRIAVIVLMMKVYRAYRV